MSKKTYSLDYFKQQGAKGGKRRAASLTPAERKASATKASQAATVVRKQKAAALARTKPKPAKAAKG